MDALYCEDIQALWLDEASGRSLSKLERAAMEEHFAMCDGCRVDSDIERLMSLNGPVGAPKFAPCASTREAWIDQTLDLARRTVTLASPVGEVAMPVSASSPRPVRTSLWVGLAAAVALAISAALAYWFYHGASEPPVLSVKGAVESKHPQLEERGTENVEIGEPAPVEQGAEPSTQRIGTNAGSSTAGSAAPGELAINTDRGPELFLNGETKTLVRNLWNKAATKKSSSAKTDGSQSGSTGKLWVNDIPWSTTSAVADDAPGRLNVQSKPWTTVYIDGVKIRNTPLIKHSLLPGIHRITVENKYHGIKKTIRVKIVSGETKTLAMDLTNEAATKKGPVAKGKGGGSQSGRPGKLSVQTKPWTTVYIDGVKIKNTPLVNHPLKPGTYTVTVENLKLNLKRTFRVKIKPGQTTTLVKTLE